MMAAQPITWTDILRHDVVPVLTGYLVFLAIVMTYWLHRRAGKVPLGRGAEKDRPRPALEPRYPWLALIRYLAALFVTGYIFFLAIVVIFYFVIGEKSRTFIREALGQGSVFTFGIVLPAFLVLSLLDDRISRALGRRRNRGAAIGREGSRRSP